MSATQQTLAQMIRSKYPDSYKDMSDTDLEAAIVKKYPQYGDLPRTAQVMPGGGQPIQDTSTLSARPSLGSRAWSAFKEGGPTALGQELGESTRNAISGLPLPGVNKTLGQGLTDLGQMADMAGTEASLLQAPQAGEAIVNMAREGLPLLGNKAASLLRKPATSLQSMRGEPGAVKDILPPSMQKWTVPPWMIPKGELGTPTNPGMFGDIPVKAPAPVDPMAEAVKSRQASWIPTRMPKLPVSEPPIGSPENPGFSSKLPTRLPPNLRGDPFNPTEPPVRRLGGANVYPEPREPMPGDRPGAAWSQGRESTLPASASRGAPGAVDVLRNIGKPIVLTPRSGIGYPSPGEFEAVREPLLGRSTPYQGAPQLRPEVQQMAIPSAASRVPEWRAGQVDAEMSRLQSILRNPQATMEEKNIAQSQLQNYQSRPRF